MRSCIGGCQMTGLWRFWCTLMPSKKQMQDLPNWASHPTVSQFCSYLPNASTTIIATAMQMPTLMQNPFWWHNHSFPCLQNIHWHSCTCSCLMHNFIWSGSPTAWVGECRAPLFTKRFLRSILASTQSYTHHRMISYILHHAKISPIEYVYHASRVGISNGNNHRDEGIIYVGRYDWVSVS